MQGHCSVLVRIVDGQLAGEVPVSTSVYAEDYIPEKLHKKYAIDWKKVQKDTKLLSRVVPKRETPKAYLKLINEKLAEVCSPPSLAQRSVCAHSNAGCVRPPRSTTTTSSCAIPETKIVYHV